MLLPVWREVTFDFDSPKNHWLFSVSDDAPEEKALRNRLGTETCDQLMRVKLETPNKMKEFEFTDALLEWRKVKDRIIFQKTADQEN